MRSTKSAFLAFAATSLFAASVASAGSITATLYSNTSMGLNPGTNVMSVTFNANTASPVNYNPAYVGRINWFNATGDLSVLSTLPLGPGNTFSTFCLEGTQDVIFGNTETWNDGLVPITSAPDPGSHFNALQATEMTKLYDIAYDTSSVSDGVGTAADKSTAFQLALWEIAGDGQTGISSDPFETGSFQASLTTDPAATTIATTWLAEVGNSSFSAANPNEYLVEVLSDSGIQDQAVAFLNNGSGPPPVPVPAALPAGLSLIGGLVAIRLIKKLRTA